MEQQWLLGSVGMFFSQGRTHDAPHFLEMPGSQKMSFLSVEAPSIDNGRGHCSFPFPGDRYGSYSARGGAEFLELAVQ